MNKSVVGLALSLLLTPLNSIANPEFKPGQLVLSGKVTNPDLTLIHYYPNADLSVVSVMPGKELKKARELRQKGQAAQVNLVAKKFTTPNDIWLSYQWNWDKISAYDAWGLNTGANSVVAVLDTGLASNATDGISCTVKPYNVYAPGSFPEDGDGHGTHVAGTINQTTNNAVGVAGLAFDACVMPVKVLDDSGSGGMAEIAEGIHYAVDNGAHVINMSLGLNSRFNITTNAILDSALDYAASNNVVVVAASGNDGNRKNISYPAIYPSVLAVGATDFSNKVTRYSNQGQALDLVAPGGDTSKDDNRDGYVDGILQETRINGNWNWYFLQGTSMASPHVAALSAMLISHGTATSAEDVKRALTETATDLNEAGWDKASGAGLINSFAALNWQPGAIPPPPETCTDADGDGVCAENDCDDTNSAIFPGANDSRGKKGRDGIDNDCNGIIDG